MGVHQHPEHPPGYAPSVRILIVLELDILGVQPNTVLVAQIQHFVVIIIQQHTNKLKGVPYPTIGVFIACEWKGVVVNM